MKQTTLELKHGLKFYVSGQEITLALHDVNVGFSQGEMVAITGESGSGKSTLAHVLAGIFPCEQGELFLNGVSTQEYEEADWERYRRNHISFIAQNYGILPGTTVMENVVSTLLLSGMPKKEAKKRASCLLKEVELWQLRRRKAGKLSSGQKQRLSVARALAKPAPILIADEPTSNLDWSIASKIVRLLAEEARHRLVIVVTHNFEVIQEYVTRHLVLRDGEVVEDVSLLKNTEEDKQQSLPETKERKVQENSNPTLRRTTRLAAFFAGLQLKARPVWTLLMILFFSVTAFGIFVFLGNVIRTWDDTGTKLYSSELYLNGLDTRLLVTRADLARMTEEDYTKILSVPWIVGLERFEYLSDVNYHYRKGTDYICNIESENIGTKLDPVIVYYEVPVLLESDAFLQTVPVLPEGEVFLTAGRLPMHYNEVVAVGSEELIGTTVDVIFRDDKNWAEGYYVNGTMEIVGVTDYGSGLYFDDRVGITFCQAENIIVAGSKLYYFVNSNASEDEYYVSTEFSNSKAEFLLWNGIYDMHDASQVYLTPVWVDVPAMYIGLSEENFDRYSYAPASKEISVFLEDYAYTDRAMEALSKLGYETLSPYRIGSRLQDYTLSEQRINTLMLSFMAAGMVVLAQVVVLAVMFGTQMETYLQLRNLGLSCRIAKASLWIQVLLFTVFGQVISSILIAAVASGQENMLTELIKFLEPKHWVVLCLIHLAASILLAVIVCRMLHRKVFSYLSENVDVDLAELEDGTEGGTR